MSWGHSRWGRRAAAGYILLLSAALGFVSYHAIFTPARFDFPGPALIALGLPWTRTVGGVIEPGTPSLWPVLLASYAVNAGMLYFIGARLESRERT